MEQNYVTVTLCIVTVSVKCPVSELEAWDRQTDIQTDRQSESLLIDPPKNGKHKPTRPMDTTGI